MELIRLSSMYAALHVFMICWCNEKELSKIIPRFLSDLLNSIGMPFICKDEGMRHICPLCGYQYYFRFVMVHLKFVAYHPGFDITYAFLHVVDGSTDL